MTTTPNPTAAETDLALRNARALVRPVADHAVPHDPIRVMLAAALLELHAKLTASEAALAESERARLRLLDAVSDESMVPHPLRERIRDAVRDREQREFEVLALRDRAQQRAAEPTPGTVLGTARVVFRGKVEPREVEAPDAPEDRYVPTVGERAVLVSSPVPEDRSMCERVVDIYGTDESSTSFYWLVTCDTGVQRTIHRDATWRPASAAQATLIADKGSINEVEAKARPGGFLDAVNAKLAHLEGKTQGMAEGTAGEFRRVDATLRAHSERIEAGIDALKDQENGLGGAIDAIAARVERIERAMEVELAAYDMRFEREERELSPTTPDPAAKQ